MSHITCTDDFFEQLELLCESEKDLEEKLKALEDYLDRLPEVED